MMTMQARELLPTFRQAGNPLRSYPTDSPRAKARLVAMALFADGRLEATELEALATRGTFKELGLTRDDFFQVLYDFCADVADLPNDRGQYLLTPAVQETLLAEVCNVEERQRLLGLIFDVIRSDDHLADGEARLFWNALDVWNLRHTDRLPRRRNQWNAKRNRQRQTPVLPEHPELRATPVPTSNR